MVIVRTPLRVSLFGGSLDFPAWYKNNEEGGLVLSSPINKYTYVSCKKLPSFLPYKNRIVYSKEEITNSVNDIKNDVVRECMKLVGIDNVEIMYTADLPAAGVSTSSSFVVGLLKALYSVKEEYADNLKLASNAIKVEQEILNTGCGSQDQFGVAFPGLKEIIFNKSGIYFYPLEKDISNLLNSRLSMFYLGKRKENNIEKDKIENMNNRKHYYREIFSLTKQAICDIKEKDFSRIGEFLHESWELKKKLSNKVSNDYIDDFYKKGLDAGASGGKLMGSGSGGFFLFWVDSDDKKSYFLDRMRDFNYIPFYFEEEGCKIIYKGN